MIFKVNPLPASLITSRGHSSRSRTAEGADRPATNLADFEHYAVTPKPRRLRDKLHREFVAAQPCLVCGRQPSDAHHLRFTQPKCLTEKETE